MHDLLGYTERRFRAALKVIPDGVYHGEDAVDDDGLTDTPLVVKAKVTIKGETIAVDFDGTCPQVPPQPELPVGLDDFGDAIGHQGGADAAPTSRSTRASSGRSR